MRLATLVCALLSTGSHALALPTPTTVATKRVVFLLSDTGGGHRASALALQDALEAGFPGTFECSLVDMFVESNVWPWVDYPAIYKQLAANPILWKLVAFDFGASPFGIAFDNWATELLCYAAFRELLAQANADLVVSVHPLLQAVPIKALADLDGVANLDDLDGGGRKTPFVTVVTDLGSAHPSWFDTRVDQCFVPSDVLNDFAVRRGLKPSQIQQFGLPIRRGFWRATDAEDAALDTKERARSTLELAASIPTVMLVGGGDGMGGIEATAAAIGEQLGGEGSSAAYQMVVICGRNREAAESLRSAPWPAGVSVRVLGFVDNMEDYMTAADLLVTKAGPGTIAEATIVGLPCVLNSFLPGQEVGNVDFVRDGGFGDYRSDPADVARLVASYLTDETKLREMGKAARKAGRPEATKQIAEGLARIAGVPSK